MKLSTFTGKVLVLVLKRLGKKRKVQKGKKFRTERSGWEPTKNRQILSWTELSSSSYSSESSKSELGSEDSEA